MKLYEKVKALYNKEDLNYSKGNVNPFEFHKTFYFTISAFRLADIEGKMKPKFFNQNLLVFGVEFIALILFFMTIVHALSNLDIAYLTEAVSYFFMSFYMLLIFCCVQFNIPQYHHLLRTMIEDFEYICTTGEKYRERFFAVHLSSWKLCIVNCVYLFVIVVGMSLLSFLTLFYYLITHKDTDEGKRPLLWPYWIPNTDLSESPYYEVAFTFGNAAILLYGHGFSFMLQTQIMWVRHMASQADVIIWHLQDLFSDIYPTRNRQEKEHFARLIRQRLREIVIKHQSMLRNFDSVNMSCDRLVNEIGDDELKQIVQTINEQRFLIVILKQNLLDSYAIVYKKLSTYEQSMSSPLACFTAYCVVEKSSQGEFKTLLALLFLADMFFYFIPNYLCTFLASKIQSICDACWDTPFWNADPLIRPYMVLIMVRSRRPLPLQTPGFQEISLETFSRKMASAYSMFNMLRNLEVDF